MKIASFNINNINRRLSNLLSWLRVAEPDIVCLQELKVADTEFPADAIRQAGYQAVWLGEKRWNGVAILARWTPVVTRLDLRATQPTGNAAIWRRPLPMQALQGAPSHPSGRQF
jgi:exodeoxyribonuclease III